jgi:hypothetical protein
VFAKEKPSRHLITRSIILKFSPWERGRGDVFFIFFARAETSCELFLCYAAEPFFSAELNVNI